MINKISPRVLTFEIDNSSSSPRPVSGRKIYGPMNTGIPNSGGGSNNNGSSNNNNGASNGNNSSCTAIPFSNGYDSNTTYCYESITLTNSYQHIAYVACDYVQ